MNSFTKKRRLLSKSDFNTVFAEAKKIHVSPFVVLYCQNKDSPARLGLVIGKKKVNKAVQRNRLKRIIRESFRQQPLPQYDIVFIAKHKANEYDNASLFKSLSKVWNQLNTN